MCSKAGSLLRKQHMLVGMDLRLNPGLEQSKTFRQPVEVLLFLSWLTARPAVQDCYNYEQAYLSHHGEDDVVCTKNLGSSSHKITFCFLMTISAYKYVDD